jgi:ribosome-binding factor A
MRVVRINELIKREISSLLHTRYREAAVRITISEVDTSPDLKEAVVYFGVIGSEADVSAAKRFFYREEKEIRMRLGKGIVIKYLPHLVFHFDNSLERGARVNGIMDSLGMDEPDTSQEKHEDDAG